MAASMISNIAMKLRTLVVIEVQEASTQSGISAAVINTKGKLIPSRPRL